MSKAKSGKSGKNPMQTVANIMKVRHDVNKAADTVQKVAKGVEKVAGIVFKATQHKEWYTKYTNGLTINLNYGIRKDLPVLGGNQVPTVLRLAIANEVPAHYDSSADELVVDSGWKAGISKLMTSMRAANSSRSDYNEVDLERYVINTLALHILYAHIRRAYACLYNFDIYDGRMPEILFKAMGNLDYESFRNNAADIKMYGNLFGIEIAAKYPLRIPLIDRKRWMFSNIFAEDKASKTSFYLFESMMTGTTVYYSPQEQKYKRIGLTTTSWNNLASAISSIRADIATDPKRAYIAAEMLKAFGSNSIYPAEIWPDTEKVPVVYDSAALRQIENAVTAPGYSVDEDSIVAKIKDNKDLILSQATFTDKINLPPLAPYPDTATAVAYATKQAQPLIDCIEKLYIDTDDNKMDTGDTLSAMRLTMLYRTQLDVDRKESATNSYLSWWASAYNTEIVLEYDVFASTTGSAIAADMVTVGWFNAPTANQGFQSKMASIARSNFALTTFNYFPRVMTWCTGNGSLSLVQAGWNWTNFATGPDFDSYVSFSGLASMSLLYVDYIVAQKSWEAVDLNTGKTTRKSKD